MPEKYDRSKIFISTDIFSKITKMLSNDKFSELFTKETLVYAELPSELVEAADGLFKELEASFGSKYSLHITIANCLKLLVLIDNLSLDSITSDTWNMNAAIEYINRNIFSEINIDEICSAVHISKYYFCRQLKK